jgi:hypothetical protein
MGEKHEQQNAREEPFEAVSVQREAPRLAEGYDAHYDQRECKRLHPLSESSAEHL